MEILWHEHRLIERVLDVLDQACQAVRDGSLPDPQVFLDVVQFVRDFADGWHHAKEERQLVDLLDKYHVGRDRVPLAAMLADHEQGRRLVGMLAAAAARLAGGSQAAITDILCAGGLYTTLLRRHIDMEDRELYPQVKAALGPAAAEELTQRFAAEEGRLGRETWQRALALIESLERRLGVTPAGPVGEAPP
jgi:hemerythrin-like domain-containing protein